MTFYHIRWTIEVEADSPVEAAQKALNIQRKPDSTATVFVVHEVDTDRTVLIDLDEDDPIIG